MSDFEYEDEGDDPFVDIENIFYSGEDHVQTDPGTAVGEFLQVIEMDSYQSSWSLKALVHLAVIYHSMKSVETSTLVHETFQKILKLMPEKVSRNEFNDAVIQVLDNIGDKRDTTGDNAIYALLLDTLKSFQPRLWFQCTIRSLKRSPKDAIDASVYAGLYHYINNSMDQSVDSSQLLQVYGLELEQILSQVHHGTLKDLSRMIQINDSIASLISSQVSMDIKLLAILKECAGYLLMIQSNQYEAAYNELFDAFKHYQEFGKDPFISEAIKFCLKLLVISSILSNSKISPFDNRETKSLLMSTDNRDIQLFASLRMIIDRGNMLDLSTSEYCRGFLTELFKVIKEIKEDLELSQKDIKKWLDLILDIKRREIFNRFVSSTGVTKIKFTEIYKIMIFDETEIFVENKDTRYFDCFLNRLVKHSLPSSNAMSPVYYKLDAVNKELIVYPVKSEKETPLEICGKLVDKLKQVLIIVA
jgi:hypothetical protein